MGLDSLLHSVRHAAKVDAKSPRPREAEARLSSFTTTVGCGGLGDELGSSHTYARAHGTAAPGMRLIGLLLLLFDGLGDDNLVPVL
jgi:hypothetical protein